MFIPGHRSTFIENRQVIMDWKVLPSTTPTATVTKTGSASDSASVNNSVRVLSSESKTTSTKPVGFINHQKSAFTKHVSGQSVSGTHSSQKSPASKHEKSVKRRPVSDTDSDLDFGESDVGSSCKKMKTKKKSVEQSKSKKTTAIIVSSDEDSESFVNLT